MAATRTAEKTERQTAKSSAAPKVFDIARPGKSAPSASSRPVIVSNRPILQDPMVSSSDAQSESTLTSKPSGKITIRPPEDSEDKDGETKDSRVKLASAPEMPRISLDFDTEESEAKREKDDDKDGAADKEPKSEKDDAGSEKDAADTSSDAVTSDVAVHAEKVSPEAEDTEAGNRESKETNDDAPEGTPVEDGTNADNSKDQKELAALEAKAKQEEEINNLVDSHEYFLPINAVERHRSKVISLLGLVLILILALVLLDVMLDSGMLHIPGVNPVTHFFSALGR